jgi:hypothetical protein
VGDRLTPEQQAAFDGGPPIERRLRPSGEQTPDQARNFAVASFRNVCDFDGIGVPSVVAVEAAIDAALAAAAHSAETRTRVRVGVEVGRAALAS